MGGIRKPVTVNFAKSSQGQKGGAGGGFGGYGGYGGGFGTGSAGLGAYGGGFGGFGGFGTGSAGLGGFGGGKGGKGKGGNKGFDSNQGQQPSALPAILPFQQQTFPAAGDKSNLYVKGLPANADELYIYRIFSPFGPV